MTHASLFSGIGGPEIAAAMLGWDNLFHCEINPFGRKVLDYWFPKSKSYEDITKTDFTEWRGMVDVLTGGFPCQPFSYAGQRRGADDDRYLWPYMFKAIDAIRPAWVVAENVAGITTMVEQGEVIEVGCQASLFEEVDDIHRYRLTETFTLQRICDDLEGHGYSVQPVLVPACAVGAPHRRDRVFIVGHRVASDTDRGSDRRTAGEDEGESGKERIQERHEVRKPDQPNQVRRENERNAAADTSDKQCNGLSGVTWKKRKVRNQSEHGETISGEGRRQDIHTDISWISKRRITADTESEQGGRREPGQPRRGIPQQGEPGGRGGEDAAERYAAYTYGKRPNKPNTASEPGQPQRFHCEENNKSGIAGLGRWDTFPTVSPVHRGNDGIPFDVDNLSVPPIPGPPTYGKGDPQKYPFSKWRTESLKAYGNAIVPQVMYEIFRAIELVSNQ